MSAGGGVSVEGRVVNGICCLSYERMRVTATPPSCTYRIRGKGMVLVPIGSTLCKDAIGKVPACLLQHLMLAAEREGARTAPNDTATTQHTRRENKKDNRKDDKETRQNGKLVRAYLLPSLGFC